MWPVDNAQQTIKRVLDLGQSPKYAGWLVLVAAMTTHITEEKGTGG